MSRNRISVPWAGVLLASAMALLPACLTINHISQRPDDIDASDHQHPGDGDGAVATPDGGDGDGDGGKPVSDTCFDRGSYMLDGHMVRGLAATCDEQRTCKAGKCVPVPKCGPGVSGECVFRAASVHGATRGLSLVNNDYIYWIEAGTYDDFHNYNNDGAVARARIGEWTREELLTKLSFFSPIGRVAAPGWYVATDRSLATSCLLAVDKGRVKTLDGLDWAPCVDSQGTAYWMYDGNLTALSPGGSETVLRHLNNFYSSGCAAVTDKHVWLTGYHSFGGLDLHDQQAPTDVRDCRGDCVGITADEIIVAVQGNFFAVVSAEGTSRNIASAVGMQARLVRGEYVYWLRAGEDRQSSLIMRATVHAPARTEVLAEVPEAVASSAAADLWVTDHALMWTTKPEGANFTSWHYLPVSADL